LNRVAAVDDAKARVAKAQENLANLQAGADPEITAGTRASLANAELSAPISGTITKLDVKVGETATVGAKVVTIADFSKWVVKTTDLTEIDVVKVGQGQTVKVALDAIPGVTLTGKVESIGQSYSEKQGDIVYEVTIVLDDTHLELRWGMTAEVTFEQ
jgi:HlyD family secretion protein